MGKLLNKCPLCGSELEYNALYQYEISYKITKYGEVASRRKSKRDVGSMECGYIMCTNEKCQFMTDCELNVEKNRNIKVRQIGQKYVYEID